jgi:hypothetical protein
MDANSPVVSGTTVHLQHLVRLIMVVAVLVIVVATVVVLVSLPVTRATSADFYHRSTAATWKSRR